MRGFHAVPRRPVPAVVTVEAESGGGTRRPRFLNLVVRAYREWDTGRPAEPVRYLVVS
ncbi:hypothetical protein [Actinophytocola gossypii]|uniref:Uncharacterized protein n=1 Tax=Actinophytocola gossypii TaxID=2812003 RepID=A0ABT2JJC2_9PSEU|nr:hypothetical protein [Actinophytocola gossypii]MCT2587978.1 hypothetical protein [Actinophytocola gossypii]